MSTSPAIDPVTGERIPAAGVAVQIDPNTGERVTASSTQDKTSTKPSIQPGNFLTSGTPFATLKANFADETRPLTDQEKQSMTPMQKLSQGFGRGALNSLLTPVLHMGDTLMGMGSAIAHSSPYDPQNPFLQLGQSTVQDYQDNGAANATGNVLGQGAGSFIGGELGGAALRGAANVASPVIRGVGRAAQFMAATPDAQSMAATRALVPGTPGDLLTRALKPSVKYGADSAGLFNSTMEPIVAQGPVGGVSDFAANADAARDAAYGKHSQVLAPYMKGSPDMFGTAPRPSSIPGAPLADAQMRSIPLMDRVEQPPQFQPGNPGRMRTVTVPAGEGSTMTMGGVVGVTPDAWNGGIVNRTANIADNYRTNFTAPELDQVREDANGKLNSFYNKAGGDRAAALSNPETARVKAVGDTAREQLYPFLEQNAGLDPGTIAANQQMYGKLSNVGDIANNRDAIFARQDPISLAEKLATGKGGITSRALDFVGQKLLKSTTDSDALARSAVDRFQNPDGTPLPSRPNPFARAVSGAGSLAPGAANLLSNVPVNPFWYSPNVFAQKNKP